MKTWIVAVSGGVDSVVLLHRLVEAGGARLIVAHVDHGIRLESGGDADFVARLARDYRLSCEVDTLALGSEASEERARQERWRFLRAIKEKYGADKIVTAHHADDVVETMIINLLRGTGWRGIASLRETDEIMRPLLALRKRDILDYAHAKRLSWREDATNRDQTYLRNHVRHTIMPRLSEQTIALLLGLHDRQCTLRDDIHAQAARWALTKHRHQFIMWPDEVAREILRTHVGSLTRRECERALLFVRVARPDKQLTLSNGKVIKMKPAEFIVSDPEDC